MGLKQTADTSRHGLKHIPDTLRPKEKEKKGGGTISLLCKSVTQESGVKMDGCSVFEVRQVFVCPPNAIHVPSLYDCMSNLKIALLLPFDGANELLSSVIMGPYDCIHVPCSVFFHL